MTLPEADPDALRRIHRWLDPVCRYYFRGEARGLDHVPDRPTLLVGNHDGGILPVDGMVLGCAWHQRFQFRRPLRVLMHEIPFQLTRGLRDFLHGAGAVSASPHNLEAVLDSGQSGLLYPGAAREAFRTYRDRATIDLGGRTGFIVRSLRRGVPITPVVSAGAHETMFILLRGQSLAEWLGVKRAFRADAWPLVAGLPWGLWWGPMWPYLPLPSKVTVEVLPPIDVRAVLGRDGKPEDADDADAVKRIYHHVCGVMNGGLKRLYAERKYPVIG